MLFVWGLGAACEKMWRLEREEPCIRLMEKKNASISCKINFESKTKVFESRRQSRYGTKRVPFVLYNYYMRSTNASVQMAH